MAKYKVGQKAILTDSDGTRDLIAESRVHTGTFTVTNTIDSLSRDYFTNHFLRNPYQGNGSGYFSGGGPPSIDTIQKYPFTTDANGASVGTLTASRKSKAATFSKTHGFYGGGTPGPSPTTTIEKFPFAIDGSASSVGDLSVGTRNAAGNSSDTHGYSSGGFRPSSSNIIDKYPFSISSGTATDVGDLTRIVYSAGASSSPAGGFVTGGNSPSPGGNVITKFPFASDTNATNVGSLSPAHAGSTSNIAGYSSETHGYTSGGQPGNSNFIDKFPFATSGGPATDVGDLTTGRGGHAGTSSFNHGYSAGGETPSGPPYNTNIIDKFPFSTDANATDVGDLATASQSSGTVETQSGRT